MPYTTNMLTKKYRYKIHYLNENENRFFVKSDGSITDKEEDSKEFYTREDAEEFLSTIDKKPPDKYSIHRWRLGFE